MRGPLRRAFHYVSDDVLLPLTLSRMRKSIAGDSYDVVHAVDHGPHASIALELITQKTDLWTSFHDHFSLCSSSTVAGELWCRSARRFVISEELGTEYSRLFGALPYEVITDGLLPDEIGQPRIESVDQPISVYFGGLLHYGYLPLFESLLGGLEMHCRRGTRIRLIVRGASNLPASLANAAPSVITEFRPDFVSDSEILDEINAADILYLPIKFLPKEFHRFSLSTKLIGYLGSPGDILYHGPAAGPAYRLLKKDGAAAVCDSTELPQMFSALENLLCHRGAFSGNAKVLAKQVFGMDEIRAQFWGRNV
jgi:hypothetical protein